MKRISVAINEKLLSQLDWILEELECTRSLLIRYLIDTYVDYFSTQDITYEYCKSQIEEVDFKWNRENENNKKRND